VDPVKDGCPHCGTPVAHDAPEAPYCCSGCRVARAFLTDRGLSRFYVFQRDQGVPVGETREHVPAFLERRRSEARARVEAGAAYAMTIAFAGIHCAACVWVIEELFKGKDGARHIALNPVRGTARLVIDDRFPLDAFAREVARVGYPVSSSTDVVRAGSDGLVMRMGITLALAMNVMMLSLAFYLGLEAEGGALANVFLVVSGVLATAALATGGPLFVRGALAGLKRGAAPLDLPIATGMFLAWGGSVVSAFVTDGRSAYFDTVTIFIALMVVGRFVQTHAVDKNRRLLFAGGADDGLHVTRIADTGALDVVPTSSIAAGDTLLIAPGDLVPTESVLLDDAGALSFAFITGEPGSVFVPAGQGVEAGAKNEGDRAVRVRAEQPYASSLLVRLLASVEEPDEVARTAPFVTWFSKAYVAVVFVLAALALVVWWPRAPVLALDVVVAILVVTCPCAIGLAVPLTVELSLARLRELGVFVRRASAIHRLLDVRAVVFDKTGTLSLLAPSLQNARALDTLHDDDKHALFQMSARSRHPKSKAIVSALGQRTLDDEAVVVETAGEGLAYSRSDGVCFALTRGQRPGEVAFSRNGVELAVLTFAERARPDARAEVARLRARGLTIRVLSGDDDARVRAFAREIGIDESEVAGGLTPDEKARRIDDMRHLRPLYVGDGLNDTLALESAWVAATPAALHPAVPARADLFSLADGVMPLSSILDVAARARVVQRRNLVFSTAYNIVVLGLAMTGHMSPLFAAVLMPLSGVATILHTALSMRRLRTAFAPLASTLLAPTAEAS
jgi:Cu2+-exporting ATPase